MSVKDKLQIFLITYNRLEKLKYTLENLLKSPIKDFNIIILDNQSNDGTKEYCEEFIQKNPTFTYIRNKINLGISGNIIRAMELASKKWLWIICDDDNFNWQNWDEIEKALNDEQYDIVHTTYSEGFRSEEYAYLINEEAFIPTCIYNTKHINALTMQNAYAMAYTLLPHHAIGCKVINEKGKIYVPQNRCVIQGSSDKLNFIRMPKKGLFHKLDDYQLLAGYISSYQLIEDENVRNQCHDVLCLGQNFSGSMNWFLESNPNDSLYNIFEIMLSVNDEKKKDLIQCLSNKNKEKYFNFIEKLYNFDKNNLLKTNSFLHEIYEEQKTNFTELQLLKEYVQAKLNKPTLLQQIFSVKNESKHKVIRILGIRIKIRRKR